MINWFSAQVPEGRKPEALQIENAAMMVQTGSCLVGLPGKLIGRSSNDPGNKCNVPLMIALWREETPCRPEIAESQQEPDPVCCAAQFMRRIHDGLGEVEESLALGIVEDRGMFKARLFGRVQDAHSGHERNRSGKLQGKRSFSLRVKYDEYR